MKKVFALIAFVAFLGVIASPAIAAYNSNPVVVKVTDEKPKKADASEKKEKKSDCASEKKGCCEDKKASEGEKKM
jgi:hypothetical protein